LTNVSRVSIIKVSDNFQICNLYMGRKRACAELVEAGFGYVCELNCVKLFRKREWESVPGESEGGSGEIWTLLTVWTSSTKSFFWYYAIFIQRCSVFSRVQL